jgi:glutamyl-Q tRNA(Asp) synthetase
MACTKHPVRRTRFAPSPTGWLHLGHAYAAYCAFDFAQAQGGEFLLRIEDTDQTRCRPEYEAAIFEDLAWLGLKWPEPVRRQSDHLQIYAAKIAGLTKRGLTYPCFCSRKEISTQVADSGAPQGPDGPLYPGTCRGLSQTEIDAKLGQGLSHCLRLNLEKALEAVDLPLEFREGLCGPEGQTGHVQADPSIGGDFVLARKGLPTSYHVSVVVDDHLQGITDVVRGQDLFYATHIHVLLQALWAMDTPRYRHHPLILDETGRRLSKRDGDLALRSLRKSGLTAEDVRRKVGLKGP